MTTHYLDTSALSKRYVEETGTAWLIALLRSPAEHTFLTARITMVEIYSALARRRREGSVSPAHCDIARQAFTAHSFTDYAFIELDLDIIAQAQSLLWRYPLYAYDAVQLASALTVHQILLDAKLPPLVFISADERLNTAASAEGLLADNPHDHP